jgi:hypothetical protein
MKLCKVDCDSNFFSKFIWFLKKSGVMLKDFEQVNPSQLSNASRVRNGNESVGLGDKACDRKRVVR